MDDSLPPSSLFNQRRIGSRDAMVKRVLLTLALIDNRRNCVRLSLQCVLAVGWKGVEQERGRAKEPVTGFVNFEKLFRLFKQPLSP